MKTAGHRRILGEIKSLVILDVMTIASLFLLRVVAGAVAVEAHASEWLLLCTAMLALFLGFTKRRQEAMSLPPEAVASANPKPDANRVTRPGARALLAPVPGPDDRDGDRGPRSSATRSTRSTARSSAARCSRRRPRSSTGSSATCT